jgi:glutamate racemase
LRQQEQPIGIFDSGIGGLTVASEIHRVLPNEQLFYFGDTARCPYGDRPEEEVVEFSIEICDFLYNQGVKMLVVACNTVTAAALPVLESRYDVPVIGVVNPGARAAAKQSNAHRIGVIGTSVTIGSSAYEHAIKQHAPTAQVYSLACPAFVPMVERGEWSGNQVETMVKSSLLPLLATDIDTLILGCTHYPHLQGAIQSVMGSHVRLISSASETAIEVREELIHAGLLSDGRQAADRYFTTGSGERMEEALHLWMGVSKQSVQLTPIDVELLATR